MSAYGGISDNTDGFVPHLLNFCTKELNSFSSGARTINDLFEPAVGGQIGVTLMASSIFLFFVFAEVKSMLLMGEYGI